MGEDERNGVYLPWKTNISQKNVKNNIIQFKHNRFNMMFLVAAAVYYHLKDIKYFLDHVHGTSNDLLKAVALDVKETVYLAGANMLGLISKLITGPLWRLIEVEGHILDMNRHYNNLVNYLEETANDPDAAAQFRIGGEPFGPVMKEDHVY